MKREKVAANWMVATSWNVKIVSIAGRKNARRMVRMNDPV